MTFCFFVSLIFTFKPNTETFTKDVINTRPDITENIQLEGQNFILLDSIRTDLTFRSFRIKKWIFKTQVKSFKTQVKSFKKGSREKSRLKAREGGWMVVVGMSDLSINKSILLTNICMTLNFIDFFTSKQLNFQLKNSVQIYVFQKKLKLK